MCLYEQQNSPTKLRATRTKVSNKMRLIVDYLRIRAQQGAGCNSCKSKKGYHEIRSTVAPSDKLHNQKLVTQNLSFPDPRYRKMGLETTVAILVPSLCRRITDDWKNRSTWLFSVDESSGRFLCSKKKLLSFR